MPAQLRLDRVTKSYHQQEGVITVFSDASAQFIKGTSYAMMGASGSGKSTAIHMLAGIDTPTSGHVFFNDHVIEKFSSQDKARFLQQHVSLVFQQPALLAELTVIENVMLKAILAGSMQADSYDKAHDLLSHVGLADKAQLYPGALSGGQQQRVAILRAIFIVPDFLLVDEPTGNLDEVTGQHIVDLLLLYQKKYGMGLVMSTHNTKLAQLMDCMVHVENKKLILQTT